MYTAGMFKNVHIILNPAAGQQEPILSFINKAFDKTEIHWEIHITKKKGDGTKMAKTALGKGADVVVAYGGDGTVMEVAQALINQSVPLAIIPGGTANVLAKDLGIPFDSNKALKLLKANQKIKQVDVGMCNEFPFIIRVNVGIGAEMVAKTKRSEKDRFGILAYNITAMKSISDSKLVKYKIEVDGKKFDEEGYALIVTNAGNVGIENISLVQGIDVSDGKLDLLVVKQLDVMSMVGAVAKTLTKNSPDIYHHVRGKKMTITLSKKQHLLIDDISVDLRKLNITVKPKAISIVVPT